MSVNTDTSHEKVDPAVGCDLLLIASALAFRIIGHAVKDIDILRLHVNKMIEEDRWVISAYNAALTDEQADVAATLKKMVVETIVKIVTGAEDVDYYDTFLTSWMNNGGDGYIADAQAWVDSHK